MIKVQAKPAATATTLSRADPDITRTARSRAGAGRRANFLPINLMARGHQGAHVSLRVATLRKRDRTPCNGGPAKVAACGM